MNPVMPDLSSTLAAEALPDGDGSRICAELAEYCLENIDRLDPRINAMLKINTRALEEAHVADQRRATGTRASSLDGVPILVKDNIDTKDLGCTAGSRILARSAPPAQDALVIRKIRSLGMVLLGKTNLSEWGNFRSTRAIEGWSGLGGQTLNAHGTNHSPGGSSSGSAAAVASGMAPLALGTETDGSIITPAGLNGVIGVKPEHGLLPLDGVVPVAPGQDVIGVFAVQLAHAALLMAELCDDPSMCPTAPADLRAARTGVCPSPWLPTVALDEAAAALRAAGVEVIEIEIVTDEQLAEDALIATHGEFAQSLPAYLANRSGAPASFSSLITANRDDPIELGLFGQEVFEFAAGMDTDELDFAAAAAERARHAARRYLDTMLARHRLDALIVPANSPARPLDSMAQDVNEPSFTTLPALAGYPNIALPISAIDGLPVGISVFGPSKLAALLPVAAAIERACPAFSQCRLAYFDHGGHHHHPQQPHGWPH